MNKFDFTLLWLLATAFIILGGLFSRWSATHQFCHKAFGFTAIIKASGFFETGGSSSITFAVSHSFSVAGSYGDPQVSPGNWSVGLSNYASSTIPKKQLSS